MFSTVTFVMNTESISVASCLDQAEFWIVSTWRCQENIIERDSKKSTTKDHKSRTKGRLFSGSTLNGKMATLCRILSIIMAI